MRNMILAIIWIFLVSSAYPKQMKNDTQYNFNECLDRFCEKNNLCIISDGYPIEDLSGKYLSTIQEICQTFGFSVLNHRDNIYILKKKYRDSRDLPEMSIGESNYLTKSLKLLVRKLSPIVPTSGKVKSPLAQYARSLSETEFRRIADGYPVYMLPEQAVNEIGILSANIHFRMKGDIFCDFISTEGLNDRDNEFTFENYNIKVKRTLNEKSYNSLIFDEKTINGKKFKSIINLKEYFSRKYSHLINIEDLLKQYPDKNNFDFPKDARLYGFGLKKTSRETLMRSFCDAKGWVFKKSLTGNIEVSFCKFNLNEDFPVIVRGMIPRNLLDFINQFGIQTNGKDEVLKSMIECISRTLIDVNIEKSKSIKWVDMPINIMDCIILYRFLSAFLINRNIISEIPPAYVKDPRKGFLRYTTYKSQSGREMFILIVSETKTGPGTACTLVRFSR